MRVDVAITGTGVPRPSPHRAGPGVLVRTDGVGIQVDAGRGTVLRLAEAGQTLTELEMVLLTHHHSDHVSGLADLVMSRFLVEPTAEPLTIVVPEGPGEVFVKTMLDGYEHDITARSQYQGGRRPTFNIQTFVPTRRPTEIAKLGPLVVSAVEVRHGAIEPAVGYRIDTPAGSVAISGDTTVCPEVIDLALDCTLLVHEAARTTALAAQIAGTRFEHILHTHADSAHLGGLALSTRCKALLLTHLIPAPNNPGDEQAFVEDIRAGGYLGPLVVARDLDVVVLADGTPLLPDRLQGTVSL
jgi:ribonuclease Z